VSKPGFSGKQTALLAAVLACSLLVALAADWPNAMRFTYTAFEDRGGTLMVQSLLRKGMKPAVDFYYPYGLLPLLVARAWFAIFGASVIAEVSFMALCNVFVAWGLARFAAAVRLPRAGMVILIFATPLAIRCVYLNVTHALEAAILVHALAEHARGKLRSALVLVTVCAFVKPTMAYVYGVVLVVLIVRGLWRRSDSTLIDWRRELGPAVLTGAALLALLVAVFGLHSLLAIQFPAGGRRSYELMGYGFFHGRGRDFWRPSGANLNYYLGTFVGVWLFTTGLLVVGGVFAAVRWFKAGFSATLNDELVLVALALHLAFVCFFYGVAWDWANYGFVLILGVLAMIRPGRSWALLSALIVGMLLLVHARSVRERVHNYRFLRPSPDTANLWATSLERDEWRQVLALTNRRRRLILKISGCAELLFPGFESTNDWYVAPLLLPILPAAERERIRSALEQHADIVVTDAMRPILAMPLFHEAISAHASVWSGRFFDVYRLRAEASLEPALDHPHRLASKAPGLL
jgi:hypothetical protein